MDSFDVSDPTDWLNTPLAGLLQVEQAFRCHVCKDFYNSPMLTSCCHSFCSLCIRRSLGVDGKCPLCRANDQESRLRTNHALCEAVDAFVQARNALLDVARAPPPPPLAQIAAPQSPKRKAEEVAGFDHDAAEHKRPRVSTRRSKAKAAEANAAIMRFESAMAGNHSDKADTGYEPDDGLVACPICWSRMKPTEVDRHLDTTCPGPAEENPQPPTSTSTAGPSRSFPISMPSAVPKPPPERLAPLNYSMLNDQALRKKLAAAKISTSGSRQLLELRHREWVMMCNANCDSRQPKSRPELLQQLAVWERTVGAPPPSRASTLGAQIKDKDFDGSAWASKHKSSFDDLIANARRGREKVKPPVKVEDVPVDAAGHGVAQETGVQGVAGSTPEESAFNSSSAREQQDSSASAEMIDLTSPPRKLPTSPQTYTQPETSRAPGVEGTETPQAQILEHVESAQA